MRLAVLLGLFVCVVTISPVLAQTIDGDTDDRDPYSEDPGDPCLGSDDPFCGSGGGAATCGDGCWECAYLWHTGHYCNPVDGSNGRCQCTEWVNPDTWTNPAGNMSCSTSGEYCFGVIVNP